MKIGLPTKKLVIIGSAVVLGSVAGAAAMIVPQSGSATDLTPVEQQVNTNTQELANHEARITNNENNIKDLQTSTGTTPSTNTVAVPQVTAVAPMPVTVVSFEKIYLTDPNIDCKFTYSDGTVYQWHWQTAGQDAWVMDGFGQNGHWVHTIATSGTCNQSVIGTVKS